MSLSQLEKSAIEKVKSVGSSELAIPLSDSVCVYLCMLIIRDLNLAAHFPELKIDKKGFYEGIPGYEQEILGIDFWSLVEKLFSIRRDAITYFSCLASLQKGRLKFQKILESQPFATAEQIGPRSLLQYGTLGSRALAHFLVWRKWLYDIDNRAAQETGYIFEPIIAHSIGGIPIGAAKSPIRRHADVNKGRQVDCIVKKRAYEFKMRVTIAASGQGRWKEELDFPTDCKASGYTPVLVVFDSTENPKLTELVKVFKENMGEVYIGENAWKHLEGIAGDTMSVFLEKYVRTPIDSILEEVKARPLDSLSLVQDSKGVQIKVGQHTLFIERKMSLLSDNKNDLPDDIEEETSGVE
ncbi:MAG: hypothetical protein JNL11_19915 [Bdellovibrionaceae bacterium]|nr:hypothetical protein [Pseudobdellovibrionaceae bacterium]